METVIAEIDDYQADLFPEEYALVAASVQVRVREFTAGRNLARALLARSGVRASPIPAGPGGQPLWPDGVTGSISHAQEYVAAAVARKSAYRGIGLDIEAHGEMRADELQLVLSEAEMNRHGADSTAQRGLEVFSCKEAAFKAVFPITSQPFGFTDIEVERTRDGFTVRMPGSSETAHLLAAGRGFIETRAPLVASIFCIA